MKIKRFELTDRSTGWHLEETAFDALNLLVGISGVGKTKIVEAIQRVQRFAIDEDFDPGAMEWAIAIEHEGVGYRWEGCTELETEALGKARARVVREVLTKDNEILVERTRDAMFFAGNKLPKLTRSDSAISLLSDEEAISLVVKVFRLFIFSEVTPSIASIRTSKKHFHAILDDIHKLKSDPKNPWIDGFRSALHGALNNTIWQSNNWRLIYLLWTQEALPNDFAAVKELFIDIFPFVEDIRISWTPPEDGSSQDILELHIHERGVTEWIPTTEMSSGMLRTLSLIVDIRAALPGSVVVIDELENSLGVNCMPEVIDSLLERDDCQFILTSHHPYIIDNIPVHAWKLVRRHGSEVRIDPVTSFPDFDAGSRHRAFIKLLNLPAFEEGVA